MKVSKVGCTLQERVAELIAQHGSLRAAARVLQVEPGYLSRLANGDKVNPGKLILGRMGIRRVVMYERAREQSK